MQKATKRIASLALALILFLALLPGGALASAEDDWWYELRGGEAEIKGYDGTDSAVVIPSSLGGYPVTSIGNSAFEGCSWLTSVTIPEGVTSMGYGAFSGCSGLQRVDISDLAAWCTIAFSDSANPLNYAHRLYLNGEELTKLTIPSEVTNISAYAFSGCSRLTSVTIPEGVTSIGVRAFESCSRLMSVTIPASVTSIGSGAFSDCCSLTSVTIPEGVTSIEDWAFSGCSLTSVTIPATVTSIGESAFSYCSAITDVYYAGARSQWTAISIGSDNAYLTDAALHFGSVSVSFDANAGDAAGTMTAQVIPVNTATALAANAFTRSCYSFAGWNTAADGSGTAYGYGAEVTLDDDLTLYAQWAAVADSGVCGDDLAWTLDENGMLTISGAGAMDLGDSSSPDVPWQAHKSNITSVLMLEGVTSIGQEAFMDCTELASVTIPRSVTGIGDYAFSGCSSLTNAYFCGSSVRWAKIGVGNGNSPLSSATIHFSASSDSFTVTFNANGGTVTPTSKTVINEAPYGELPTAYRTNYTFNGWFTSASGGTQITSDTTVNLTANQTLYAQWTLNRTYTVTYNANGGTGAPSPQTKEENVALTLSNLKPTKSYVIQYNANGGSVTPASKNVSCTFKNWNTIKNGSGTSYTSGAGYTANADVTLYAQWTNPKAGDLAVPTRSGYAFEGWFTSAAGGTQISASSTIGSNTTLYAHWTDPYNMGDETYSFENYGDSDSPYGHCFGMSITSAGYHNGLLDIGRIGGNANTQLYDFEKTAIVMQPICRYQGIQGNISTQAIVAGGSAYKTGLSDISADWASVVAFVRDHAYDDTGLLQIGFRKNSEGGHAINFLRYENVNGQDRIYAYDSNFPNQETYFYQDSYGYIWQAPQQTFSGPIDCIALRDCRIYFSLAGEFDTTHVLYMPEAAATVVGYTYSYMEGDISGEPYVMYEIPSNQNSVIIVPLRDNADFIYMDTEYSFGEITDETRGELRLATMNEGAVSTEANFRIFTVESETPTITVQPTDKTIALGAAAGFAVTAENATSYQ